MEGEPETRRCVQCDGAFEVSAGEREFYRTHRLRVPKRCRLCRRARKGALGVIVGGSSLTVTIMDMGGPREYVVDHVRSCNSQVVELRLTSLERTAD